MDSLLDFFKKYYHWLLFLVLEVICFALLFQHNRYQGSVFFTSANTLVGKTSAWYAEAVSLISLKETNRKLTQDNIYLQKQVADLREALDQSLHEPSNNEKRVSDSLSHYTLIPAKVVSNSLYRERNHIVIDKGEEDGIHTDMGVVGGGGVVGIVCLTGPHYSLVLPSINTKSNISCRIRHRNYFGYLQWEGGSICYAVLNDIPRYARIRVGDYVETSGYSSVFPSGIFVGKVSHISNAPDGLSLQLKVNLGTDFGNLTDVCVIENNEKVQIDNLRKKFEDLESTSN